MPSYYEILGCNENATYDELKESYRRLVRQAHPDKTSGDETEEFLEIDRAWKTLRDVASRKEYDASLKQTELGAGVVIYGDISISNLTFDEDDLACYPCRCGESFEIRKGDVSGCGECLIECDVCSNCILIRD